MNKIFSIVIPVWPDEKYPFGLSYIDKIDYPQERFEVILSHGLSPCKQRNKAAQIAEGDIIVFFDNDSCPEPNYLKQLTSHFENPEVAGVGGPNPGLPTAKFIPNLVEAVFTNPLAIGGKYARYRSIGKLREGGDSDFIFCNFAIRKKIYKEMCGLDERLCPNEENEFLERFRKAYQNKKLLYDPKLIAYEPRSETIRIFLKKIYGYGKGRARQFKIRPTFWSSLHVLAGTMLFIPILFMLFWGFKGILPFLIPYLLLLYIATLYSFYKFKYKNFLIAVAPMVLGIHLFYFLGLWKGLIESIKKKGEKDYEVKLEYYIPKANSCS